MSLFIDNQVSPQWLNLDELYYIKPSTTFVEKGYYPPALLGKLTSVTGEQFKRFLFSDVKEVTSTNPIQTIPWIFNGQQRTNVTFAYVDNDEDDEHNNFYNKYSPKYWNVVKRDVTSGLPAQQLARQKGLPPHLGQYINSFLMPDRTTATPYPPSEQGGSRRKKYKKTNKRKRTNKRRRTNRRR